jgi:hypothetical protein
MNNHQQQSGFHGDQLLWDAAEGLISPDPNIRDSSLDQLKEIDGIHRSPLVAYLLVSRISEPDLEIRFHLIRLLGSLMDFESSGQSFSDQALDFAKDALDQMEKSQLIKILEVAESYLTAERAISNILKLSSYAGVGLSGIVNDRKLPVSVRQQAVFYCGEIGYLSSKPTLQNLVQRVDKARTRPGNGNERKKSRDEEFLYPFVISALEKLNS